MALLDLQGIQSDTRDHNKGKRGNSGASKGCGGASGLSLLLC